MPLTVTCPLCGADGTSAANDFLARQLAPATGAAESRAPAITLPASENPVHLSDRSTHSPSTNRADLRRGLADRSQAEHEARAKMMWGDSKDDVTGYLLLQGFSYPAASELATTLFKERVAAVRANGIRKMIIGFGLMWVPVIALFAFKAIGVIPIKLMGVAVVIGLYGGWLMVNGLLIAVAPKSERGDVADQ